MTSPFSRKSKSAKEAANTDLTMDDVSKEAKGLVDKILSDVGKSSATKQLLFGSISGWFTGYLMMKVGKAAAISVGGGIILLQIANHNGYVKVNWDRIYRNVEDQVDKIEASSSTKGPKILDKVYNFAQENTYMAASFVGGFLIGTACS
uniref:FUN14 domain-containing protein n=1 Tax=Clastoptera arizonana TaxID=38151 RepID=A0A1B6CZR6_9HEMI